MELVRASDFGTSDQETIIVNTHLGEFITYNDTVLCYDLSLMTIQELEDFDNTHKRKLPQVVIVRKAYPKVRRHQKKRIWKLQRMDMEAPDSTDIHEGKKKKAAASTVDRDYQDFLNDIEEQPDMRQNIMLFKVSGSQNNLFRTKA